MPIFFAAHLLTRSVVPGTGPRQLIADAAHNRGDRVGRRTIYIPLPGKRDGRGIGRHRACPNNIRGPLAASVVGDKLLGRLGLVLDPGHERGQDVERRGGRPTPAMVHSRNMYRIRNFDTSPDPINFLTAA